MRILIADDSKAMRILVTRCLRQAGYGNHTLVEASSGAEALATLRATPADLVLCDWNMPDLSGLEVLKAARKEGISTPFGFVTSEIAHEIRQAGREAGARFFITKPFTAEAFQRELSDLVK